jgi:hypothetical protein
MSKKNIIKVCAIIVLTANLIAPSKGNAQTNNNLKGKRTDIKNPELQQKQIKKILSNRDNFQAQRNFLLRLRHCRMNCRL